MDNQQDQSGTSNPSNAGRNPQNQSTNPATSRPTPGSPESTASGAAASSRKSAPTPSAQGGMPTSGTGNQNPTGAERQNEGQQANNQEGTLLDTALQSGKKWIEDSGVLNSVNQLPQTLKDFGNRAVARVGDLSTTQKVVGGALLAVGLGWLATRKGKSTSGNAPYNYGRSNGGDFGRKNYGYQAPDASTSRRTASGASNRSDSGSPYANTGSRYAGSGFSNESTPSPSGNIHAGSGRAESGFGTKSDSGTGFGASATTDHGSQSTKSNSRNDFGNSSIE